MCVDCVCYVCFYPCSCPSACAFALLLMLLLMLPLFDSNCVKIFLLPQQQQQQKQREQHEENDSSVRSPICLAQLTSLLRRSISTVQFQVETESSHTHTHTVGTNFNSCAAPVREASCAAADAAAYAQWDRTKIYWTLFNEIDLDDLKLKPKYTNT